jgi:heat shock protein HtpX
MPEHMSFFDAAEANKRNSLILLGVLFIIFLVLVVALSYVFGMPPLCCLVVGFIFILIYTIIVFYQGDKVILSLSGAKEVTERDQPFLYNVVEGLALASSIPMPKLYIINDPSPNAFATGRDPKHASIAVTSGLLSMMSREELEGVVAHEMSHVANFDIRFSMIAIVFAGAIALLSEFAMRFLLIGGISGGNNRRRGGEGQIILIVIGLIFMILAPIFAQFVRMALSRQREYLADANGAKLTRYPPGLASALEKIKNAGIPTKAATDTTASLYFANPFPNKMNLLMATHPPIDDRIKRLRAM